MYRILRFPLWATIAICMTPAHAQTMRDALESAWAKQPAQRAQASRTAELDARRRATDALTPEPASIALGQRSDQWASNLGRREWEIELTAPLWLPGQRERQRTVVDAESGTYSATQTLAKWRLADAVRDAAWQARIAAAERGLMQQRVDSASLLAADVTRRVKAGDLAKVDANRAQAEQQAAQIALGEVDSRAFRALQQYTALTGLDRLPTTDEQAAIRRAENHPQQFAQQQQATLAQKRVDYAAATRRDPPELSVALARERSVFEERYGTNLMLRLKVPFATDARNQPKLAAAQVERAEAEATQGLEDARIDAEIASARRELEQAEAAAQLCASRLALMRDSHQLLARAFDLGELDLSARLRAEADRFEAERSVIRARLETGRAISKLNQALGILP